VHLSSWREPDTRNSDFSKVASRLIKREKARCPFRYRFYFEIALKTHINTSRTFKQTMIEANIWGAFQQVGFELDTSRYPYRLRFNEEELRRSPGLQDISALDFSFEKLSAYR
jgi:hypothetical protein